jgi:hypothetical protein
MRFYLFIFYLFIFALVSCNNGDRCYDSVDTLMVTSVSVNGFKPINALIINGVDRKDVGDTLVNDTLSTLTKRYMLPLSLSSDSTGFVLKVNGTKDTLYIRHTMIIGFVSEFCGLAPNYIISGFRYTKGIDSVKIFDSKVNPQSIEKNAKDQNISIYFNFTAH